MLRSAATPQNALSVNKRPLSRNRDSSYSTTGTKTSWSRFLMSTSYSDRQRGHPGVMTNKFSDVNKGTGVLSTKIKPMNSRLTNEISMQQGRFYFRKTLEPGMGLGTSFKHMHFK